MKYFLFLCALLAMAGCGAQHASQRTHDQERINIGYGSTTASQNTQPVNSLNMNERALSGYSDLASYLQGKIAGVRVGIDPVTGRRAVFIRGGMNSFLGSSAALIVVDGADMDFESANAAVSLHQVKRIDVLKEGSIYGARGANGVVLITTK